MTLQRNDLPFEENENIASATECTGLMPAPAETEEEAEDYARLYRVHPVKPKEKEH